MLLGRGDPCDLVVIDQLCPADARKAVDDNQAGGNADADLQPFPRLEVADGEKKRRSLADARRQNRGAVMRRQFKIGAVAARLSSGGYLLGMGRDEEFLKVIKGG